MMPAGENLCPQCGAPIAAADINVQEGVALCRACGKLSRLGDIAEAGDVVAMDAPPPQGCRVDDDGARITVRASARSIGGAAGAAFVCLFWNGIVSVFVLIAISGLYANLVGPLPAWFPAPVGHGAGGAGRNSGFNNMPLGMTLFLCVFLIPFVTIGLVMIGVFLTCLAGEVRVRIEGMSGSVWTGVGPVGWTRRFDPSAVKRVALGQTSWRQNNQTKPVIEIEADRKIKFGSVLNELCREWMLGVLRTLLVSGKGVAVR